MKGTKGLFRLGMMALALSFMIILAGCDNPTDDSGNNTGQQQGGDNTGGDNTGGNNGGSTGGNTGGGNTGDNTGGGSTGGNTGGGTTVPSAPTGVTATAQSSSSVSVSWSAVTGATSYKVYYEIGSSSTKNLAGTATSTNYTHSGLDASTTYYYYIKAVNSAGESGYSSYSSSASATTSSGGGNSGGTGGGGGSGETGGGGETISYTIDQALFNTSTTKKSGNNLAFNWTLKTSGKTPNGLYTYKAPDSIEIAIQSGGSYVTGQTLAGSAKTYTLNNYATYVENDRVYLRITCVSTSGNKISYAVYRPSVDTFSFSY